MNVKKCVQCFNFQQEFRWSATNNSVIRSNGGDKKKIVILN